MPQIEQLFSSTIVEVMARMQMCKYLSLIIIDLITYAYPNTNLLTEAEWRKYASIR